MASTKITDAELFRKAEKIYRAALSEVVPENLIKKNVSVHEEKLIVQDRSFDLRRFDNIYLVAIGKAAPFMAKGLRAVLKDRIKEGIALYLPQNKIALKNITALPASHPLPDERSFQAAQRILNLATKLREKDLMFVLISGGGSAQISLPASGISLEEKRVITDRLLLAGADITELNTVRKHLSRIKGGRLAQEAFPATVISLVISDVRGNDLENIASGPTHWDSSTYGDAFQVLKKYNLWDRAPASIRTVIKSGVRNKIQETVKREAPIFKQIHNIIIGDNLEALRTAKGEAEKLGFRSFILTSSDHGEARKVAQNYVSLFLNVLESEKATSRPLCLLAGGELTVTVKGKGKGGRNQEFALASLIEMKKSLRGEAKWLILSIGTDGIDGPTDAAGAWITPSILETIQGLFLDPIQYLNNNDSYNFFKKVGRLILTGPTHTNVMDLRLFLIE
ncbi:MAG: glycerate kinase [Candidatus Aminicenantes bacterium]|nr:MAG: glycerate kinase [Candidatus Aminicenantes bacterium]